VYDQRIEDMNPHWAPQSFLLAIDKLQYDFLGRFEYFEDSIGQLVSRRKLRVPEGALHSGQRHATSADRRLAEHYTRKAEERVREIYREDFGRLGYGWSL
jgi:hypothetical protein